MFECSTADSRMVFKSVDALDFLLLTHGGVTFSPNGVDHIVIRPSGNTFGQEGQEFESFAHFNISM